jgi:hypothetical protein
MFLKRRKTMKLLTILFLNIASFSGFLPNDIDSAAVHEPVTLAKCAMPVFENAYRDSKAIFAGQVLSVRSEGDEKIFRFRVEKYWKGGVGKTVEVRYYETMRYQAWLRVGQKYLVYARGNENGSLSDGRCSLTKNYSEATTDLKKLGRGRIAR